MTFLGDDALLSSPNGWKLEQMLKAPGPAL